jgi:hypothetical protein
MVESLWFMTRPIAAFKFMTRLIAASRGDEID